MKNKAIAVTAGALLTLILWAIVFAVLNGIYQGDLPWAPTGLAALLCAVAGGCVATRLSRTNRVLLGALGGFCSGLVVLVAGVVASRLAPNTTLASIGLVVLGTLGGSLGALLGMFRRADRLAAGTGPLIVLLLVVLVGLTVACSAGKATQPELVGTQWTLVSLNGEPLIEDTEIGLYFEEAQLGGNMTCNGYGGGPDSGRYSAKTDGTLSVPILAVTVQACASPKGVMEQEAAYIEALQGAARYRVIEGRLEIEDASGATTLVFR